MVSEVAPTGTLTPISGGLNPTATGYNGRLPVGGLVKLCLLNTECSITADVVLTQPDPTRPGGIKGIGIGGLLTINVLNGVAKSRSEIAAAIDPPIKAINVDSLFELERIRDVAAEMGRRANVALRLVPELESGTAPGTETASSRTKFGMTVDHLGPSR